MTYSTDLGAGNIVFTLKDKTCTVIETNDPYMPIGTEFPISDIEKLNSTYEVV